MVTSTGSGLAVPDWPLSYGQLMPPMVGGIRFEHGHRMIAATVGLLTLILTVWIGRVEPRRWVRGLAIAALGAVVLQGILGGLTVLWRLPTPVSIAHALLGQTFFVLVVLLATILSDRRQATGDRPPSTPAGPAALTTAAIYGQLLLGAALRHGGWRPELIMAHLAWAAVVVGGILWTARVVLTQETADTRLTRRVFWLVGLVVAQVGLGFVTWVGRRPVWGATAHVAVGALLLANAAVLTWHALANRQSPIANRQWLACLELTKPRLTLMAVLTTLAGFYLGTPGSLDLGRLTATLVGAGLLGAGAGALNQYLEREADARMARTRARPLPAGRLAPQTAVGIGGFLTAAGLLVLAIGTNGLTVGLGAATVISYLAVYTPLKTRTTLCTLVGAIPGALPPLMGWAAARGALDPGAWGLFALLFLWQLPHFLALAWLYREEYAQAGFRMLPVLDASGALVGRQIVLYCAALLPVSLLPTVLHLAGGVYFFTALILSTVFLGIGAAVALTPTPATARRLFLASLAYLPGLLAAMAWNKVA